MVRKAAKKKAKKPVKQLSALDLHVIEQVKRIRNERGYSQAALSFDLHYSDSFISQMESKNTAAHYKISHLNEIAKVLKCSIHDFFPKDPL